MPGKVTLRVTAGPIQGRVFEFDGHDTFIFGRGLECHAKLAEDDSTASRHHFLLEVAPPSARLRDLGSLNGTHVNGVRHGGRARHETPEEAARRPLAQVDLANGDVIRVGHTIFEVSIDAPAWCCQCGTAIAPADQRAAQWMAGTYLCPECRKRPEPAATPAPTPAARGMAPCRVCGRPVPAAGELCHSCRARGQDISLLEDLLQTDVGPAETPRELGDYEVIRTVGKGGMGAVYLARRKSDSRTVALKVMLAQAAVDEASREVFRREIEVTRSLRHPAIVELYDHGSQGNGFFFAMEYCAGGSVADVLIRQRAPLPPAGAVRLIMEALEGLAHAHDQGFIHRDLKPENLLLTDPAAATTLYRGSGPPPQAAAAGLPDSLRPAGGGGPGGAGAGPTRLVKITDFGLAKSFQQAGLSGMTATGTVAGTLTFMPKEQLTSFRLTKPVSDVWSMGATLYYLLTRQFVRDFPPGQDPLQVILKGGVVPLRRRDPRLSEALAAVVDRAVTDDVKARYQTAREFHDALAALG